MKILRKTSTLKSQKGQGTVEYILVLVVSVGIILGGVYQLNDAFKNWAENYFGNYLACLLETGELPSIGGAGGFAGSCDEDFQSFTLTNGRPLIGGQIGAGDGSDGGSGNENNGGGNDRTSPAGSARSAGGSGAAGRPGSRFRTRRGGGGGLTNNGNKFAGGKGKGSGLGGDGALNVGTIAEQKRSQRIPLRGASAIQYGRGSGKAKEDGEKKGKVKAISNKKEKPNRRELIPVTPALRKTASTTEIEEFSFGNYLRYLIIAGILIALLLLLGGQALQIGKSME